MQQRLFFSVGVPTYDRIGLLKQCLLSIVGQTFTNFEVVVDDDCTKEALSCSALGIEDPGIRFVNHIYNLGEGISLHLRYFFVRFKGSRYLMIKSILSSQLRINMVSGTVTTAINAVVMVIAYPVYLHFLGYEKYGVWLVLATVLTFAQLGDLGMNPAIMKLVAEEYSRKNIEGIQNYITTALAMLCTSGIIVLAGVLIFKLQIIALFKLSPENVKLAVWLLPYIGILSIYIFIVNVFNAMLSGLGRMDLANYIQTVSKVIAVAVASVLLYLGRGIESMIISSAVSYLFIQVVSIICVRKMISIRILHTSNLNAQYGQRLLSFGGVVFGGSLIGMFFSPFNKLMLSRYAGVSTVPIYEIAYTGSMQVRALIESGLRALMPEISRIGADMTIQAKNKISQLNSRAMKLILMFGIPIYGVLAIFAPLLLRIWLGDRFVETLPVVFRIMLIGTFLSLLGVPAFHTLMGVGRVRSCFLGLVIPSVVNAFLVAVMVVYLGTLPPQYVAGAVVAGAAMSTFYLIWYLRRPNIWLPFGENGAKIEGLNNVLVGQLSDKLCQEKDM